jgi:hypothetical protein
MKIRGVGVRSNRLNVFVSGVFAPRNSVLGIIPPDESVTLTEKSKQNEASRAMRAGLKAASVPFEKIVK